MTKDNTLNAKMEFSELLGAEYNLYMYVGDTRVAVRIPASGKRPEKGPYKIAANMDKAHFFDKESTKAICH